MKHKFLVATAALLMASAVQAVPVHWTLQDFIFTDGGTAVGSFIWDLETNTYSDIDITTTPGSAYDGDVYRQPATVDPPTMGGILVFETDNFPAQAGETILGIVAPFDQQGGIIEQGIFGGENLCPDEPVCGGANSQVVRSFDPRAGATLIGEVIPIPAAAWLFGSALGLLGWLKRRTA